ncbi:hypothetical protein PPROV_001075100 [Pycnococcus provasolii]|uniref:Phosducin thioredoxin-like domain-containing protein n=1 Tax=Pycnococcus provasolii TaxID=41880 RepID=A0A830HY54_9CHLO|nr:hypothetical protein PPROV_001075100 [Pycnococcus provasolii]
MADACCGAGLDEDDFESDPTLAECCRRDLRDQRDAARLRSLLDGEDVSKAYVRTRNDVLGLTANQYSADVEESSDFSTDDDGDGDDDAAEMAKMRDRRLSEMKAAAKAAAEQSPAATTSAAMSWVPDGCVTYAKRAQDVVAVIKRSMLAQVSPALGAVLHVATTGVAACDVVDEALDVAAGRFPNVAFVRTLSDVQPGVRDVAARCVAGVAPPSAVAVPPPCLIVLRFEGRRRRRHAIVSAALPYMVDAPWTRRRRNEGSSGSEGDECAIDADDVAWLLRKCGVDPTAIPQYDDDDDDGDDEDGAALPPCPDCGRTYPHTHVRAVRKGGGIQGLQSDDYDDDYDGH